MNKVWRNGALVVAALAAVFALVAAGWAVGSSGEPEQLWSPSDADCTQQELGQATLTLCGDGGASGSISTVRWGEFCTDDCERLLDRVCQSSPWPQRCGGWMNPATRQVPT